MATTRAHTGAKSIISNQPTSIRGPMSMSQTKDRSVARQVHSGRSHCCTRGWQWFVWSSSKSLPLHSTDNNTPADGQLYNAWAIWAHIAVANLITDENLKCTQARLSDLESSSKAADSKGQAAALIVSHFTTLCPLLQSNQDALYDKKVQTPSAQLRSWKAAVPHHNCTVQLNSNLFPPNGRLTTVVWSGVDCNNSYFRRVCCAFDGVS